MIAPIEALGATPRFFDIRPDGSPDLSTLDDTPSGRDKAMLCAHYFGRPVALREARAHCDAQGLRLIEDCSHAFFRGADSPIGTSGDFIVGSLPKFFPLDEGGILARHSGALEQEVVLDAGNWLRNLGGAVSLLQTASRFARLGPLNPVCRAAFSTLSALKKGLQRGSGSGDQDDEADETRRRFPAERVAAEPSWLSRRIARRIDPGIARRRANFAALAARFAAWPGGRPLFDALAPGEVPYVFPLLLDRPAAALARALRETGIPCYQWNLRWHSCPSRPDSVSSQWAAHLLQLPCHQSLLPADIEAIHDTVTKLLQR